MCDVLYALEERERERLKNRLEAMKDKIDKRSMIRGMKGCCQNELIANGTLKFVRITAYLICW
jgi:hypothetical protein